MRAASASLVVLVAETGHPTPEGAAKAERDLAAAVAPPAPALPPVTPEVVAHGRRDRKEFALTFDACSTRPRGFSLFTVGQRVAGVHPGVAAVGAAP